MVRQIIFICIANFVLINCSLFADNNTVAGTNGRELADKDCSSKACFPKLVRIGSSEIPLASSILFRYYIWKPYSIALYAEPDNANKSRILDDVPKKLVLHYHMDFSAKEIIEAADEILRSNPAVKMKEIEKSLTAINALYQDVKEGDSYSLEYNPSEGTKLILNDKLLGIVPGVEFAKSYFGIWLSDYSLSSSLTDSLLARMESDTLARFPAG